MSDKISTILGDIVRWIVALIALPFVIWILFLFFIFPFEWILSKTTNWKFIFHFLFWIVFGGGIIAFTTSIGAFISMFSKFLVRQEGAFSFIFFLAILALVGFCLYGAWSSNIDFSWELFRFRTFNRILFSIMILQLFQVPLAMYAN